MKKDKKSPPSVDLATAILRAAGIKPSCDLPYICDEGHVHGKPTTVYTLQIVARDPADHADVRGLVAFNVTTGEDGTTPPLDMQWGEGVKSLDLRRELLEDGIVVWSGAWVTDLAQKLEKYSHAGPTADN